MSFKQSNFTIKTGVNLMVFPRIMQFQAFLRKGGAAFMSSGISRWVTFAPLIRKDAEGSVSHKPGKKLNYTCLAGKVERIVKMT
jgi:hypothetical protein